MKMNHLNFISNNVIGLQAISKRIKIFEYLKNYVTSNGFVFLQETTLPLKMRRYGMMNSENSYFSLMVKPALVVLLLVLWVQRFKHFKHKT